MKSESIIQKIKDVSQYLMWLLFGILMICIQDALYQTFKDFYYNISCMALLVILMLVRKEFRPNRWALIPSLAIVAYSINYLYDTRNDWGFEYKRVIFTRHFVYAMIAFFIFSLFFSKKKVEIEWKRTITGILCLTFVIFAAVMEYSEAFKILFPIFVILSVGKLSKKELKKQVNIISLAMYSTFFVLMTWSLVTHPEKSTYGRYEGIFFFPIVTGLLSSIGIIAAIHFVYEFWFKTKEKREEENKWIKIARIGSIFMALYPFAMLFLSTNRASWLGTSFVLITYFFYCICKSNKMVKAIAFSLIGIMIVGGCFGFVWMSHNFVATDFIEKHNLEEESSIYYLVCHLPSVRDHSNTAVFEPGTVGDALDYMSSDRVGIWVAGLRQVTLLGKNETAVTLPDGCVVGHVHSTLIDWLMRYGLICGTIGIAWILTSIGFSIFYFFKKQEKWIVSFAWLTFAVGVFIVEKECFAEMLPMVSLLLQYSFFYNIDDEASTSDVITKETTN